jgi:hypothetical protein
MKTIDSPSKTSRSLIGRITAFGFVALALAACGAADEPAQTAASTTSHESASVVATDEAPSKEKGRRAEGDRGKHGRRGPKDPSQVVERFDANGDGKLAVSELPERAQKRFGGVDQDKDGFISVEELKARGKQRGEKRFAKLDANGDGFVTKDEAGEKRWDRMKVADKNGDDKLTLDELKDARESGQLQGKRHRRGEGAPRSPEAGQSR